MLALVSYRYGGRWGCYLFDCEKLAILGVCVVLRESLGPRSSGIGAVISQSVCPMVGDSRWGVIQIFFLGFQ